MINGVFLYKMLDSQKFAYNVLMWKYVNDDMGKITMCLMTFTLSLWVISVLLMLVAVVLYIPLVIQIKGNLKEFCCHKIDKRYVQCVKQ
jgi:hypothetical protein